MTESIFAGLWAPYPELTECLFCRALSPLVNEYGECPECWADLKMTSDDYEDRGPR